MSNYKNKLHEIKAFAFDVDGVFTDGGVLMTESGDLLRNYNAKDGYAVRCAVKAGYKVAIITGGVSHTITRRFEMFDVTDVYLGKHNKLASFEHFCKKYSLDSSQVLFMGDDIPDLSILQHCGMPCCPADAVTEVRHASAYISLLDGGQGCVRDIIEQVMRLQKTWYVDTNILSV